MSSNIRISTPQLVHFVQLLVCKNHSRNRILSSQSNRRSIQDNAKPHRKDWEHCKQIPECLHSSSYQSGDSITMKHKDPYKLLVMLKDIQEQLPFEKVVWRLYFIWNRNANLTKQRYPFQLHKEDIQRSRRLATRESDSLFNSTPIDALTTWPTPQRRPLIS